MTHKNIAAMAVGKAEQIAKISDRITSLKDELHSVTLNKKHLERQMPSVAHRLNELSRSLAPKNVMKSSRSISATLPIDKMDIEALKNEAEQVKTGLEAATHRHDQLVSEIESLAQEMAALGAITSDDLACWQNNATITAEKIRHIKEAIEQQQQLINEVQPPIGANSDLLAERGRLLAEIALGEADQGELKKLDSKIAKHENEQKTKESDIIKPAEQTIAGLQDKLSAYENTLEIMKQQGETLLAAYLSGVAESLGNDYVAFASQLTQCFSQLIALSRLLEKTKGKHIRGYRWSDLLIPAFALKACNDRHTPAAGGILFNAEFGCDNYSAAMKAEVDHILSRAPDLSFAIR